MSFKEQIIISSEGAMKEMSEIFISEIYFVEMWNKMCIEYCNGYSAMIKFLEFLKLQGVVNF